MKGVTVDTWPEILAEQADALDVAVAQGIDFEHWPHPDKVVDAKQPRAIAEAMIPALHPHLKDARIGYLWVEAMEKKGRIVLGKASVCNAKLRHYGEVDFLIEWNWSAWKELEPHQLAALVDHELMHCNLEEKKDEVKAVMVSHDIEEFGPIVSRWGLWKPDLQQFAAHVQKALQLDLFGALIPSEASGIESVTLSTPGRAPVTISRPNPKPGARR